MSPADAPPAEPAAHRRQSDSRQDRILRLCGLLALGAWGLWWADALVNLTLRGAARTWIQLPAFGVDFWTQPDWAVRIWVLGTSPYLEDHMFHYPPIVIQLFRWVLLFEPHTALRVWVVALASVTAAGAWLAWSVRSGLGLGRLPLPLSLSLVLFSFPVIFALERANFDLITLMAILLALAVTRLPLRGRRYVAGAALSVGPWVKIYPGLLGLALVGLRWWRALAGFVVGGIVIGVLEPEELVRSLALLKRLIAHHSKLEAGRVGAFDPWSHSLSVLAHKMLVKLQGVVHVSVSEVLPASVVALVLLGPLLAWVTMRTYRSPRRDMLAFPLMCWFVSAASFVPEVANDYSLVFLPLAALAVFSGRDPLVVRVGYALGLVALQPVAFPISGFALLAMKVAALCAVAASLVGRAGEVETVGTNAPVRPRVTSAAA